MSKGTVYFVRNGRLVEPGVPSIHDPEYQEILKDDIAVQQEENLTNEILNVLDEVEACFGCESNHDEQKEILNAIDNIKKEIASITKKTYSYN